MNIDDIRNSTVLIVDDSQNTIEILNEVLSFYGFTVIIAEHGEEAIQAAKTRTPDIILLDVLMPGIDGFEACQHLKDDPRTRDIPVIFMSAFTEIIDKVRGFDVGGVDYITKPFQNEEVVARIAAHLRLRYLQKDLQEKNLRLQQSQQYARSIIESSLNMIITVDTDRRIVEFNRAAESAFGYQRENVIGKHVSVLYADPEESSVVRQTMVEKQQSIREVFNKRKNGEVFPCLLSASALYDVCGEVIGYMGISHDITELKQAQDELQAAHDELQEKNQQLQELNAGKDKFFSIISHDLRGSFGTLLGFAELMTDNSAQYTKEKMTSLAFKLRASAEKLYALLENLLTWSRIQRGVLECSPNHLALDEIARINAEFFAQDAERKKIVLHNLIQKDTFVYVDYSMVNTILRNLLSNALKFTSVGGSITISVVARDERFVTVSVTDTGVGIPEDILPRLLRIDTQYTNIGTAGEQGTGLGLVLCKELVEKNGGTLWVQSTVGTGTTFTFTLPKSR